MSNQSYKDSLLYRSGDVFLPKRIRDFLETPIYGHYSKTKVYITYWSIMHLISGVITGIYLKEFLNIQNLVSRLQFGILLHTIWELWQVYIGMASLSRLTGKNGLVDIILDTIFFIIGMLLIS